MFVYMYLIGLLIGLGLYALTYLFVKEMENKKRVFVVVTFGVLTLVGSLTVIGGFEGMPFGVLSLGILTISILLAFFGAHPLWRKSVYTFVILFVISYSTFMYLNKVDYWIVKKHIILLTMLLISIYNNYRKIQLFKDIKPLQSLKEIKVSFCL